MKLFIPITKVDAKQRLVYGTLAAETPDKSGEIFDYESSKPLFQAWSSDFQKATDGKSLGNMRAMHGNVAAGKFTAMEFLDDEKRIDVCGKVVDDAEWAKVEEGVYTGFSIGGRYEKRWKDADNNSLTRYTAAPVEGSLVDNPCIPTATFSMIKEDGSTELRKFKTVEPAAPSNDAIAAKAREMAKAAGDEGKWADHIEAASAELVKAGAVSVNEARAAAGEEPLPEPVVAKTDEATADPELEQVWKAKDGQTFKRKADAIKHNDDLAAKAAVSPLSNALAALKSAVDTAEGKTAETQEEPAVEAPKAEAAPQEPAKASRISLIKRDLAKGLYDIARMAAILDDLNWLQECLESEALWEGDNSPVPGQLKANIGDLIATLKALVDEETAELMGDDMDVEIVALAAKPISAGHFASLIKAANEKAIDLLEKAGARHSAADLKKIQSMHDTAVELGASCDGAEKHEQAADLSKVTAERDELAKAQAAMIETVNELTARVLKLEKTPAPANIPAQTNAVDKAADAGRTFDEIAKQNPDAAALALIHAAQRFPQQAFQRGK